MSFESLFFFLKMTLTYFFIHLVYFHHYTYHLIHATITSTLANHNMG